MMRLKSYIILLLFSLSFTQENPDVVSRVATSAANWLKIETGTRAIGMGGAFTSVGGGLAGVPYNPASLTFVDNQEGFLSTTEYFAGITHNVLGYASNMSGVDFASLHMFFLDSGKMPVTKDLPYAWYETPNIHFFTIKDFHDLCKELNIIIEKSIALTSKGRQFEIPSGISGANLFTSEAIFLLSYQNFKPIKLQSKQKSFVSNSAIIS